MFCCTFLYVHSSIAIILMGKRDLVALLNLSSWCLVMVERLFLAVPRGCLRFVIVVFPDHTHYLCKTHTHNKIHNMGNSKQNRSPTTESPPRNKQLLKPLVRGWIGVLNYILPTESSPQ